jgi:hypothetical protein
MKTINQLLVISTLTFATQMAQAHITEDIAHTHEGGQLRSTIQAMSPADRLNFQETMRANLEGIPAENRQAFRDNMRSEQGMGQGNQHMYGGGSGGMGGGGYGRGFGRR